MRAILRDRWVIGFAVAALLVQLVYRASTDPVVGVGDQIGYQAAGRDFGTYWATGLTGEDNVLRMPGYALFLAFAYSLGFGDGAVQVLQAILLAGAGLAVAGIAGLIAGRLPARVAAGCYAFYLPLLSFSTVFLTEALSIALMLFGLLATMIALTDRTMIVKGAVAASVLLSAAAFTRPNLAVTLVLAALALLLAAGSARTAARVAAAILIPFALMFGPWVERNMKVIGEPYLLGSAGNTPLALGVHLPVDEESGPLGAPHRYARFFAGQRADGFTLEVAVETDAGKALRDNITQRPLDFLGSRLVLLEQTWLWPESARNEYGRHDPVPYLLVMLYHLLIVFGGLAGLVVSRRRAGDRLLLAVVLSTAAPYLLFYPEPRYVLPALPALMVGLAIAVVPVTRAWRARVARTLQAGNRRAGEGTESFAGPAPAARA